MDFIPKLCTADVMSHPVKAYANKMKSIEAVFSSLFGKSETFQEFPSKTNCAEHAELTDTEYLYHQERWLQMIVCKH